MTQEIKACRACDHTEFNDVINLGEQYLSDFREDDIRPPRRPLHVVRCQCCDLVQLTHTTPATELYHERYSFKSGISEAVREDLADVVRYALWHNFNARSWLDIACNDGTLLRYVPRGVYTLGIDPLIQYRREVGRYADEVITGFFDGDMLDDSQVFDVITAVSVFYDVDDPRDFLRGIRRALAPDGVCVIQQNYLPTMMINRSVDNISHEHLAYYRLATLMPLVEAAGLEIIHIAFSTVNGGCFRVTLAHRGRYPVHSSVSTQLRVEAEQVDDETYKRFRIGSQRELEELSGLVHSLVANGKRVYVYGASTRGAVIWQAAALDATQLPRVVERNPDKVGRRMSAIGSLIISEEEMRADPPDYLLVGPWWLRDRFIERERTFLEAGGRFIFPLPAVEVVGL